MLSNNSGTRQESAHLEIGVVINISRRVVNLLLYARELSFCLSLNEYEMFYGNTFPFCHPVVFALLFFLTIPLLRGFDLLFDHRALTGTQSLIPHPSLLGARDRRRRVAMHVIVASQQWQSIA